MSVHPAVRTVPAPAPASAPATAEDHASATNAAAGSKAQESRALSVANATVSETETVSAIRTTSTSTATTARTRSTADSSATLWGSILQEASSSKAIPRKHVLVLGDRCSGKSALVSYLKQSLAEPSPIPTTGFFGGSGDSDDSKQLAGLALSFTYSDVYVEGDDEPMGRLGLFELESADPTYCSLMRFALIGPESVRDSAVIICLDCSRPWDMYRSLAKYLVALQRELDGIGKAEGHATRSAMEELREQCEFGKLRLYISYFFL